jgi:hypothetical protein
MAEGEAHLLLPCLRPRDLEGALRLSAAAETRLAVTVNGRPVADLLVGVEARDFTVRIPAETLFRGDNDLSLAAVGVSEARVGLERFTFRAM